MKLKEVSKNRNILSNASVFMAFLAFSFLSFSLVSPIVSSNADTNTASTETGPYISSISVDSLTSINITPTSTQSVYTGTSAITYSNSCPYGMNVTLTSASDSTSLTRYGEDSATKEIPSTTTTSLADNTWGVSADNGSTYSPIPSITATPANIINTFEATTNPATLNLIYGVKADSSLPSGSYTNDLVYTVSVKPQCLTYAITWNMNGGTAKSGVTYPSSQSFGSTLDLTSLTPTKEGYEFTGWSNGTNTFDGTETAANINPSSSPSVTMTAQWEQVLPMQGFSCSTLTNVGDSVKLRDTRDNNVYTVKKLADGKCWMTENLRITGKTITSADSNVTSDFTIPASSTSGFNAQDTNNAYVDSTYGGYYTFYTATAGTGGTSLATDGANAPSSICPKGWHLPTGGSTSEFNTLYGQYNSAALMMNIPNFTLSGVVGSGSVSNQGSYGSFWSSTVSNANRAYDLGLNSSSANPAYRSDKHYGFSVRCMADNSISDIIYMQDITPNIVAATATGTTATLTDIRDNNTYTVRKLKDGNVWMTQNLRIINKTISSADSNLPSGETYTVPASNVSSFTKSYNTNAAYLDSTYGAYYNFYTATAGWGTDSVASGNSPKDICPKGWRLPTGNSSGEFKTLYGQYNSAALMMDVPSFTLSGYVSNGSMYDQGSSGYFWSSTVSNASRAYSLYLSSSSVNSAVNRDKYRGFSVRCVTDQTMQKYDVSQLRNTGDSIMLTDERDGNKYTVKKLADGKVWMTENLRLINKTISSADSNLPAGETWTIPASSISGFSTNNTNNAYLDSTYGGYYSFYTTTAGWGTDSVASDNSPKDICPKGWRLPTGNSSGEFNTLYGQYNSAALMMDVPSFTLSGYVSNGSMYDQGSSGGFWSSTVYNANNAYRLYLNSSNVVPANRNYKYVGFSVRCMAQ